MKSTLPFSLHAILVSNIGCPFLQGICLNIVGGGVERFTDVVEWVSGPALQREQSS